MTIKKTFTCVVCPIGCELHVSYDENDRQNCSVHGNSCPRGANYARTEIISPVRTLTSTVRTDSSSLKMLPVRTDKPIPKEKLFEAMRLLNEIRVNVPVNSGDVIAENFVENDVNLVACRTVLS